ETRWPIRLVFRYGCAWQPSSGTKILSGLRPSRSRTRIPADIGKRKASLGLPAYDAFRTNPYPAWIVLPGRGDEPGSCAEHHTGRHAASAGHEPGRVHR